MTDYAAAPSQPIVQGLISTFGADGVSGITFFGKGIVLTGPNAPRRVGAGDYILTLDPGLPGDVAIDPPFGRFMMTVRTAPGIPALVTAKSVTYLTSPPLNPTQVGANQIEILLANAAGAPTDVVPSLEIILWRADAGVELVNANLIGPLFNH